jgi:catechol 2,3-dioxygenase-like lactoylglutathione lyase family enzyme
MGAKIRHIAIFSSDPPRLAKFYNEVFGLTLTGVNAAGAAWITDGYMDVALLKRRDENPKAARPGINHWGFTIEAAAKPEVLARMKRYGVEPYSPYLDSPNPRPYVEDAVKDPDGNKFDLSTGMRDVRVAPGEAVAQAPAGADCPKIQHIAIFADNPAKLSEFYTDCFGLTVTGESQGDVWVTDGYVDVALISRKNQKAPRGIHHWGFTLDAASKPEIYARLKAKALPPKDPRAEDPSIDRPYVEDAGFDIDGNRYDLTTGKRDMDVEKARTRARLGALEGAK